VHIGTAPFGRQAEFDTLPETRANSLGLAFDPVPGGYHVHGDVIGTAFGMRTNTPEPITITISLSGGFGAGPDLSTFGGNFNDPVRQLQVSFDPSKPVLNDIPAGFTVSGLSVVDNHWTNPFAPSGDVAVTSCAMLSQPTVVHGNLTIHNLAGCPTIALPNLTRVDGDIIIDGIDTAPIQIGPGVSVGGAIDVSSPGGDLSVSGTDVGGAIDVSSTGGDLTIEDNDVGEAIDVGGGVGGDLTIVDNGDAVVNAGAGQIGGDSTIESGGDPLSATTADGSTSVTLLDTQASMHALLPAGAFDHPVSFTIARTADTPPEAGTAPDGSPAQVDPILGFRFSFAVPTLDADARLTFTVDLSRLDATGRADLLNAIAAGNGTIAVKGDAANAALHAFAQCRGSQVPTADGCVAVTLLNASGSPVGPVDAPAFARFDGVVGHFSTYVVARVLTHDAPPTITAPSSVTVDATGPSGALVRYPASVRTTVTPRPAWPAPRRRERSSRSATRRSCVRRRTPAGTHRGRGSSSTSAEPASSSSGSSTRRSTS
jgi:hypothetical protein